MCVIKGHCLLNTKTLANYLGADGLACLRCDTLFATICGGRPVESTFFVDVAACVDSANARCAPCAERCADSYQEAAAVSDLFTTTGERCLCACRRKSFVLEPKTSKL